METSTGVQGGQIKVDALANDGSACFDGQDFIEWARSIDLLMATT